MTDKEIRKLRRTDLLQLLIAQIRENKKLQEQLNLCRQELEKKTIILERSGSIAQAAMELSGVFAAAQQAADLYLEGVRASNPPRQEEDGLETETV